MEGATKLARWLVIPNIVCSLMDDWIFPESRISGSCTIVQKVAKLGAKLEANEETFIEYDSKIKEISKENGQLVEKKDPQASKNEWEQLFYNHKDFLDNFINIYINP